MTEVTGNIIISSGNQSAPYLIQNDGNARDYNISNNMYHNDSGGAEPTGGNLAGDASPIHQDPQISGYLYNISANSPAYSQINFPHIVGGWGPPGFVIPSSSNHSDP